MHACPAARGRHMMIEVKDLTKKYGSHIAVDGISMEIRENEVLGFLGPNGAGKSTTMNMITGFLSATSGTVLVGGADVLLDPLRARKLIGYLPEVPPLYKDMTPWEYLSFVHGLKRCPQNRKDHIQEIARQVGIDSMLHRLIGNLSKGYQQRVGLAQALLGDPPVLILDEPTVGLDPAQIVEIRELICELGQRHTVILSTHILPEAQLICDRIVMIQNGRLVADGLVEELTGSAGRLCAEIRGVPKQILTLLRAVPGVADAQEAGGGLFLIQPAAGKDIREELFYALAEARMPLMGLRDSHDSLERAFLQIMTQGALERWEEADHD